MLLVLISSSMYKIALGERLGSCLKVLGGGNEVWKGDRGSNIKREDKTGEPRGKLGDGVFIPWMRDTGSDYSVHRSSILYATRLQSTLGATEP